MEAMVAKELPTVAKDQIACWLSETAGSDEAGVQTATMHLEGAQTAPTFALCLLKLAAGITFPLKYLNFVPVCNVVMLIFWSLRYKYMARLG